MRFLEDSGRPVWSAYMQGIGSRFLAKNLSRIGASATKLPYPISHHIGHKAGIQSIFMLCGTFLTLKRHRGKVGKYN
jgi:hypothetical protein